MLASAVNAAVRLLLAPECAACGEPLRRPLDGTVCAGCWQAVRGIPPPCCVVCGDAFPPWRAEAAECARCRRHPPSFAAARSAGQYDGALREIVHAFKYQHRRPLAAPLAALMRVSGADLLDLADAVVPVPLHPWRAFQRGFNQADDLARLLGLPVWRLLRRCRHGPPQAHLPASRRHANVRRAYACRRLPLIRAAAMPRRLLRDRVLVVVDDVMTTGATLDACSRVLMDAGARTVFGLTVARAVAGRPAQSPPRPDLSTARRRS